MIGPFGRQWPVATLRQHCPQMTQRRCKCPPHLFVDEEDEGEGDCAPEPAVHHDELVDHLELVQPVLVGDEHQQQHAQDPARGFDQYDLEIIWLVLYLKTVQKVMVRMTNAQFHSWSSWMVATPRNMKMIVSEELFEGTL